MSPKKNTTTPVADTELEIEETIRQSVPFIGQWQNLISTTNWEKGQIICAWRGDLAAQGLSAIHFSDETWSRIVGGVSPQHVGRLRRTFERFGGTYSSYTGVYWSHFYAALDWDDAEMWLEGAVQNQWSVSQMRVQRWEHLGGDPQQEPRESEIVAVEIEEELGALAVSENLDPSKSKRDYTEEYVPGPRDERPDFGDEAEGSDSQGERVTLTNESNSPAVKLFAAFDNLPEDVSAVAEDFKLCILRHKTSEWAEISLLQMLNLLDALKQLAGNRS